MFWDGKRCNDGSNCGLANDLAPRTPDQTPCFLQTGHSPGVREGMLRAHQSHEVCLSIEGFRFRSSVLQQSDTAEISPILCVYVTTADRFNVDETILKLYVTRNIFFLLQFIFFIGLIYFLRNMSRSQNCACFLLNRRQLNNHNKCHRLTVFWLNLQLNGKPAQFY